jgi:hypothetical protein
MVSWCLSPGSDVILGRGGGGVRPLYQNEAANVLTGNAK